MFGNEIFALVICSIILRVDPASAVRAWQMMIKPAVGHIKPNESIVVMCRANIRLTDCQFKVSNGAITADMDFSDGKHSLDVIPKNKDKELFLAKYTGTGLENGQCGMTMERVITGLYVIGCRAQADFGDRQQDFMTLAVDDLKPFKLQSKPRYKVLEPGSDVHLLCFTPNNKPLVQCSFKLPSIGWVVFHKGHNSKETSHYQYSGRGLEKGQCGVKLMNVTEADSGVIWCNGVNRGGGQQYRAITIRVAPSQPVVELAITNTQLAIGDRLRANCSLRGVYPLPMIAWYIGDEPVRKDAIDDTQYAKANYKWLWEMQSVTQELDTEIKSDVAHKELKCSIVLDVQVANATAKLGDVKPNCGYRMETEYDNNYKHVITKRGTSEPPKGKKNLGGGKAGKACRGPGCPSGTQLAKSGSLSENHDDSYEEETMFFNLEGDYEDFDATVRVSGGTMVITPSKPKVPSHIAGGSNVKPTFGMGEVNQGGTDQFLGFPWHAGLYRSLNKPDSYTLDCGGTLISKKHVITAAHCVWDDTKIKVKDASIYKVVLGKIYSNWAKQDGSVQRRSVSKISVHPSYRGRRNNFQNDIAILEIADEVQLTKRVNVACVDWNGEFEEEQLKTGNKGTVTGWGYTEDEQMSEVLRYVDLPYMEPGTCFEKVDDDMKRMMTADKFCAGFSNQNTSVCPGDSGGGLLFSNKLFGAYYLRGIVSVSFRPPGYMGKCFMSEVTGFTTISHSLKWIKSVTGINA